MREKLVIRVFLMVAFMLVSLRAFAEEDIAHSSEKLYVSYQNIHLLLEGILVDIDKGVIKVPAVYRNQHGYYICLNESEAPRERWYCLECGYSNPKRELLCEHCRASYRRSTL